MFQYIEYEKALVSEENSNWVTHWEVWIQMAVVTRWFYPDSVTSETRRYWFDVGRTKRRDQIYLNLLIL